MTKEKTIYETPERIANQTEWRKLRGESQRNCEYSVRNDQYVKGFPQCVNCQTRDFQTCYTFNEREGDFAK